MNLRFGEHEVLRTGNVQLECYDKKIGGSFFDFITFEFQNRQYGDNIQSYLSHVILSSHFTLQSSAEDFFNFWHDRLWSKYGGFIKNISKEALGELYNESVVNDEYEKKVAINETVKNGVKSIYSIYGTKGRFIILSMEYSESKSGKHYWYVTIEYCKNFVDESNDY